MSGTGHRQGRSGGNQGHGDVSGRELSAGSMSRRDWWGVRLTKLSLDCRRSAHGSREVCLNER